MPSQNGRDFLFKIGNGGSPTETFTTIGAARALALTLNNQPQDATTLDSNGLQELKGDAGTQSMVVSIDGFFKDGAAEETFRAQAFARTQKNYRLVFPNGDTYEAAFVVQDYARRGSHDGLETFSATLARSGDGTYTPA